MLDKPIEEIVYEGGKVVGVKSQGEVSVWGRKRCAGCGCKAQGVVSVWGRKRCAGCGCKVTGRGECVGQEEVCGVWV